MPTYEYRCDDCGCRFERFQKMSDAPVSVCPDCGGKVRRVISAGAAVIVKGSGSSSAAGRDSPTRCGQDTPCCGRDTPCQTPPCEE